MTPDDQSDGDSDPLEPTGGEGASGDSGDEQPGGDTSTPDSGGGQPGQPSGRDDQPGQPGGQPGQPGGQGGQGGQPGQGGQGGQPGQPGGRGGQGGQQGGQGGQPGQPGGGRGQGGQPQGGQPQGGQPRGGQGGQPQGGQPRGGQQGRQPAPQGGGGGRQQGGDDSPSLGKRIGLVVLGLLLTLSVLGASGIFAAQGTVLSSEYVADKLDSTNATAEIEQQAESTITEEVGGSIASGQYIPNADSLVSSSVEDLVTEAYVGNVIETNLDNLFAYLKGSSSTLTLAVDASPVVQNVSGTVESKVENIPFADLIQQGGFAEAFSFSGYSVTSQQLAAAYQDPARYRQLQTQFSTLLSQSGQTRADLNRTVEQETRQQIGGSLPPDVVDSIVRIQQTYVLGLTTDLSHDEFRQRIQAARDEFAAAVGTYSESTVRDRLNQAEGVQNSRIDVTERISDSQLSTLNDVRDGLSLASTLGLVLPILALIIILIVAVVTHSISATAKFAGTSLLIAGILGIVGSIVGKSQLESRIQSALSGGDQYIVDTVNAIFDGLFSTLTTQNAVIAVVGVILLVVWFVIARKQPDAIPPRWR